MWFNVVCYSRFVNIVFGIRLWFRCHGLSVYPVCVCNTVRLGQVRSRDNLKPSGTRFECVSGLSVIRSGRSRHNLQASGTPIECVTGLSLHYAGRV